MVREGEKDEYVTITHITSNPPITKSQPSISLLGPTESVKNCRFELQPSYLKEFNDHVNKNQQLTFPPFSHYTNII